MTNSPPSAAAQAQPILWAQVGGLALVQGSITLCWVVYNLYLGALLTGLGFPQAWAATILVIENLLGIVMEPLMGTFSDRQQHLMGTRFPLIALGVVLSAGLFFLIPTALIWGQNAVLRWLLPLLLVAWATAMTMFRSPALSLLGRYAFRTKLPQATSLLTLVGGLAGALGPFSSQWILSLGPGVAFTVGSLVLLGAMLALRRVGPNQTVSSPKPSDAITQAESTLSIPRLALVFGTGVGVSLGFRMMLTTLPAILKQQVSNANVPLTMGLVFLALASTALPAGTLATRLGNRRAMISGLALLTLLAAGMLAVHNTAMGLAIAACFGGAFSLVANGTMAFALSMVPSTKAGLGTGIYFSGGALAMSLWGLLLGGGTLSPGWSALLAAVAFLLAGLCVGGSQKITGRP